MWIDNSINSTDGRNGRNFINIRKKRFLEVYGSISNSKVVVEEQTNKRGRLNYSVNRMVSTIIVKVLQEKLKEKGVNVSNGTVISLRPFFITYPTDKEIALCLCKLCLNAKMMYDVLVKQAKEDGDEINPNSLTNFYMSSCPCSKSPNGYYKWKCGNDKCSQCKKISPLPLKSSNSSEVIKISQFELTKTPYVKINKDGKVVHKVSEKTEKVETSMPLKDLYNKLLLSKKSYTKHKYQVHNDIFHWPRILSTSVDYGNIYHMDFSENLAQSYKYEPQSSHFNKQQYSLHCMVKHFQGNFEYLYHLSDEKKHDHAFTATVVNNILEEHNDDKIIRFKSDNCSTQYKCRWVFKYWQSLAIEKQKK